MKTAGERIAELAPIALEKWGPNAAMIKTCEELAELTQQLCKKVAGAPVDDENVIDEIADVLLMTQRMSLLFGPEAVNVRIHFKLDRLEKALK